jgi:hypothetical protein
MGLQFRVAAVIDRGYNAPARLRELTLPLPGIAADEITV